MKTASPRLEDWTAILREVERACPWPGPRPLEKDDDAYFLVGRDTELRKFRQEVASYRLVILTGASGVGKTSLLEAGLVPTLSAAGYTVAVCREWSGKGDDDPASFLAAKVRQALADTMPDLEQGPGLFWDLYRRRGDQVVIVLDQFEELIRYAGGLTAKLYELLLDLNHGTGLNIVISLRNEYEHMLRPLEKDANPYTLSRYILDEVDPKLAGEVITRANRRQAHITEEAATFIAEAWQEARGTTETVSLSGIGLLHLQAVLYALHAQADGEVIDTQHVRAMQVADQPASHLFTHALTRSIEVKLARCRQVAADVGVDPFLIEGAVDMLTAMVPHLSSGGFKLVREARDLADATIGEDLNRLLEGVRRSGGDAGDGDLCSGQYQSLFATVIESMLPNERSVIDLLAATRGDIAAAADERLGGSARGWVKRLHPDAEPSVADPTEVTSGPMLGLAPAAVLIEELRRYAFAVAWLHASSLTRVSTPGDQGIRIALTHDGFGEPLQRWSKAAASRPDGPLHALTAPGGAVYEWPEGVRGKSGVPRLLVNLRWRGSWVTAPFMDVTFVNCDLRGTFFAHCEFEGVTFLNCLLDGMVVIGCDIRGHVEPASAAAPPTTAPVRLIDGGTTDVAATLARYRGLANGNACLLSQRAGAPAVPTSAHRNGVVAYRPHAGGLVVQGGLLSSMVVRNCTFSEDGMISLRQVVGHGVEVSNQPGGRFEIVGSDIRHLSVTHDTSRRECPFVINAVESLLFQCWFGDYVSGTLTAKRCTLVHIWSRSPDFVAMATGCDWHGLVGITLKDGNHPFTDADFAIGAAAVDPTGRFRERAVAAEYQRIRELDSVEAGT